MTRVYTDMAADIFHVGHLNLIKRAKQCGDYLIVGVHSDEDISKFPERVNELYEILRSSSITNKLKFLGGVIND